jgi:hypothetical protein
MFTLRFWNAAAERAIKTFAQTLLALIGANLVKITDLDWPGLLLTGLTAALISILTSVVSSKFGNDGPSLADEELTTPHGE